MQFQLQQALARSGRHEEDSFSESGNTVTTCAWHLHHGGKFNVSHMWLIQLADCMQTADTLAPSEKQTVSAG